MTPAYALTATERVLPRMALDFTTGVLDPRVTVTRALNTATRVNSSGVIETVNANLPRFDYDPVTLAPKGLLIEETRTNLCTYSGAIGGTNWSTSVGGVGAAPVITLNAAVAPDGTTTASRIQFSLNGGTTTADISLVVQALTGTSCRGSWYIKTADNTTKTIYLRAANSPTITVDGTWRRYDFDAGTLAGSNFGIGLRGGQGTPNSNTADLHVWGAQLEAGAFATSYIPTTLLATLRNADDVTMSGTNFTSWYNASEGSLSLKYLKSTTQVSGRYVARFFSPTVGAGVSYWINSNGIDTRYWIGATNAAIGNGSLVNVNTGAFSYKTATSTGALNGAANVANAGTVPLDVTEFRIGDAGGINAHIQRILYWPFALTAAEIRANSKG